MTWCEPQPPLGPNHALLIGEVMAALMAAFHDAPDRRQLPSGDVIPGVDEHGWLDTIYIDRPSGRWAVRVEPVAVREH